MNNQIYNMIISHGNTTSSTTILAVQGEPEQNRIKLTFTLVFPGKTLPSFEYLIIIDDVSSMEYIESMFTWPDALDQHNVIKMSDAALYCTVDNGVRKSDDNIYPCEILVEWVVKHKNFRIKPIPLSQRSKSSIPPISIRLSPLESSRLIKLIRRIIKACEMVNVFIPHLNKLNQINFEELLKKINLKET